MDVAEDQWRYMRADGRVFLVLRFLGTDWRTYNVQFYGEVSPWAFTEAELLRQSRPHWFQEGVRLYDSHGGRMTVGRVLFTDEPANQGGLTESSHCLWEVGLRTMGDTDGLTRREEW